MARVRDWFGRDDVRLGLAAAAVVVAGLLFLPPAVAPLGRSAASMARYGVWLVAFTLWMAWFVLVGVRVWRRVDALS
jgi:hypothetical protein